MSENEKKTPLPNNEDQILKTDLLGMIHNAENPFDILYHIAVFLEKKSAEPGYAQTVLENIRTVYGVVLGEKKLLTDELQDVESRLARIEAACQSEDLTEEESTRAGFAVTLHKKNIERLKNRIHELEANGESLYFSRE